MPSGVYGIAKYRIGAGLLTWPSNAVLRVLLVAPTYVFANTHRFVSDVAAHEVSDASYSRRPLTNPTAASDVVLGRALLDAEPTHFPELTNVTVAGAVLYEQQGGSDATPSDDALICYLEFPSPFVADGTDLLVQYDPLGVISLT